LHIAKRKSGFFAICRMQYKIAFQGFLLFLFIPLVLTLFLKYPFGVLPSFGAAVAIMFAHRLIAKWFFFRNSSKRCFWCGSTKHSRSTLAVNSGETVRIQLCAHHCVDRARKFLDFCFHYRFLLRLGILFTLLWYVVTMILNDLEIIQFPPEWNRFLFQFVIALTVVSISFAYTSGHRIDQPAFPFPIHNLFLLGAKNTLLVFRYVGFWWLAASFYFLWVRFRS
jgi:hypothetical protein